MADPTPLRPFELTGDTITLNDSMAAGGDAYRLCTDRLSIVRAFQVYISGTASTRGADVTIIAHRVVFGPSGVLDTTSAKDTPNTYPAGAKPATPVSGGADGVAGAAGASASSAGNIVIYANNVVGTVTVRANGGRGGRGQDGGDGAPGGDGDQNQRQIDMQSPSDPHDASGPPGGTGGHGGEAGAPGTCGNGGNLDIWTTTTLPPVVIYDGHGGAAPEVAQPGQPGGRGRGGAAPAYYYRGQGFTDQHGHYHESPRRHLADGVPGPPGPLGGSAPTQTQLPAAGSDGLLNGLPLVAQAPPHQLSDAALAEKCNIEQLWEILQTAELNYYNDDFIGDRDPGPRLSWIASLGSLLAEQAQSALTLGRVDKVHKGDSLDAAGCDSKQVFMMEIGGDPGPSERC